MVAHLLCVVAKSVPRTHAVTSAARATYRALAIAMQSGRDNQMSPGRNLAFPRARRRRSVPGASGQPERRNRRSRRAIAGVSWG